MEYLQQVSELIHAEGIVGNILDLQSLMRIGRIDRNSVRYPDSPGTTHGVSEMIMFGKRRNLKRKWK